MRGLWRLVRRYGLDLMIGILAVGAMVEVAVGRASPAAPRTSPWFDVAAIAVLVLPLFVRRRFPFGAPTAYWLLGAALSFVDGRLVTFPVGIFVTGMMASFLLGDLRDGLNARLGLGVVLAGAEIVIFNKPEHSAGELVFIPLVFGVCWLGGYAVRERAGQVEVAEARATQAEREREAAARIAVAEERVRIARELHDIVAHALSVMVLQVGAVRHKLPRGLEEDRNALLEVRPETRARDLVHRWSRSKEPPSTGVSVFDIRAARSAEGDAGDGPHERQRSARAFRPHL